MKKILLFFYYTWYINFSMSCAANIYVCGSTSSNSASPNDSNTKKRDELRQINETIEDRNYRKLKAEKFAKDLSAIREPLTEFDEEIFHRLVQEVRIGGEDDVEVVWRNGMD